MVANQSILFIAGDPSGDMHAAAIIRQLKNTNPSIICFGIGGPAMQAQGFNAILPFAPFNRMGFVEVLLHLPFFLKSQKKIIDTIRAHRPSLIVCVDYPGFNIPIMKAAHKLCVKVLYYIVPQVWAWKKKRAATIGANADHLAVIFPFEPAYFKPFKAPVSFVGHPLLEDLLLKADFSLRLDRATDIYNAPLKLAIIPGSRAQEVRLMLRPMVAAFKILKQSHPRLTATISQFKDLPSTLFDEFRAVIDCSFCSGDLNTLLDESDFALCTSGTATLQCAVHAIPAVIAYRTSTINYAIMKRFVTLPYIGLPNIVAGEKVLPECIQQEVTGDGLARAAQTLIDSWQRYDALKIKLKNIRDALGNKKPAIEVAGIIESMLAG